MTSLTLTAGGDLLLRGGDLVLDEGIGTSVLVSLLCDARVDDVPAEAQRGWWADAVGSQLWLLEREKATPETAARARDLARRALRWLVTEGIASSVEVTAELRAGGALELDVVVVRAQSPRWDHLWEAFEDVQRDWSGGALRIRGAA
jgi:phage gp46-like protein